MPTKKFILQKESGLNKLESVFDTYTRSITGNCITTAYSMVYDYWDLKAPDWMTFGRGDVILPYLKNLAVEFQLVQACNKGLLPFTYEILPNRNNSACYTKFTNLDENVVLTANQTKNTKKSSRDAIYRNDLQEVFQSKLALFEEDKEIDNQNNIEYYSELNHGYQSKVPTFAVVGIPDANRDWFARLNVLQQVNFLSKGERKDLKTVSKDLAGYNEKDFKDFIMQVRK